MFIGHFGVGFGLKRMAPRVSLGLLIAATVWADILWTVFLLLGWEHARISIGNTRWTPLDLYDYPCSHSLIFMALWATALALAYRACRSDTIGAVAIWIGVVSHWLLDWLTHRPDMPFYPNGPKHGLGLWNSIPGTLVVELVLFVGGVLLYSRCTRPARPHRPLCLLGLRGGAARFIRRGPLQQPSARHKVDGHFRTDRHLGSDCMALVV